MVIKDNKEVNLTNVNGDVEPKKEIVKIQDIQSNENTFHGSHSKNERTSLRVNAKSFHKISATVRGNWDSKWEFLLSCVGLSVGIGNVWRFPYLAYQNGGGAFLIPYLIVITLVGKPMYFMELSFGQFASKGPFSIWSFCPIGKGVGAAMVGVCLVVSIYYNVVMSYTLYYIGSSFNSVLPWTTCDGYWTVGSNCSVRSKNTQFLKDARSSSQVYWERKVLEITDSIEEVGGIKWDLALCLAISWIIVILCLLKGVKSSGKVVYFAATFPYAILLLLLIAGLTQNGAWTGILYFITPVWKKLLSIKVWMDAASQMFFSLGVSMGALIMFGSYNDFRHNIFRDAMVVTILDTMTSIIAGLVIFSVLGAISYELGMDISEVVKAGPGLAFIAYPEALSRLPIPQLWSILFFLMLFMLGLDSEFALLETVLTSIADEIPFVARHKMKFTIGAGIMCFILGLSCVTRGGQYVFEIMDQYGGGLPLVYIAIFECIGIMWIYGYSNVKNDLSFMLKRSFGAYWNITWKYTSPLILTFIGVYSLMNQEKLKLGNYIYPLWANILAWGLACLILMQIPGWAIYAIIKQKEAKTLKKKIIGACNPLPIWGPVEDDIRSEWKATKSELFSDKSKKIFGDEPAILKGFMMNNVAEGNA